MYGMFTTREVPGTIQSFFLGFVWVWKLVVTGSSVHVMFEALGRYNVHRYKSAQGKTIIRVRRIKKLMRWVGKGVEYGVFLTRGALGTI